MRLILQETIKLQLTSATWTTRDGIAIFLSISSPQRLQRDNVVGNEGMTNIVGKLREEQTTTVR